MTGGDLNITSALVAAFKRITPLMGLGIIASVVAVLTSRRRSSIGGRIAARAAELAWEYTTYLAVPAIVISSKKPIEAIEHSARLIRKTWGEQIAARVGFGLLSFLFMIPGVALIVLGFVSLFQSLADSIDDILFDGTRSDGRLSEFLASIDFSDTDLIFGITMLAGGVFWFLMVLLSFSAMRVIYKTGLYVYATTGVIPAGFEEAELEKAFVVRCPK
ncbi:MAG: DUF6159 family protein [Acidimicrobiaceae bacterium]|nr:DUF6159 family protein [Acidimicrobiaceae bacterium]